MNDERLNERLERISTKVSSGGSETVTTRRFLVSSSRFTIWHSVTTSGSSSNPPTGTVSNYLPL